MLQNHFCICNLFDTPCPIHCQTLRLDHIRCLVGYDPYTETFTYGVHAKYVPAETRPKRHGESLATFFCEHYQENSWEELKMRVALLILEERKRNREG